MRLIQAIPAVAQDVASSPPGADVPDAETDPAAGMTRVQWLLEIMLRIGTVALVSIFLTSLVRHYLLDTSRISLLVFAFAEALTVALAVFSRIPRERDWSPVSVVMSCAASFYYLAFRVEPGVHLIPEGPAVALQIFGVLIAISAKWSLRRSFGILPANRGVVVKGPYRLVRHPMYLGYLVKDVGFVLPNFGLQNLLVVIVFWSLQIGRIMREEKLLSNDELYCEYKKRVRRRLLTGVF
jgi:protein-S-isoprenylcysteine O-methyltransferase Ste14